MKTKIIVTFLFLIASKLLFAQSSNSELKRWIYYSDNTIKTLPWDGFSITTTHGLTAGFVLPTSGLLLSHSMMSFGIGGRVDFQSTGNFAAVFIEPRLMKRFICIFSQLGYSPTGFIGSGGEEKAGFFGGYGLGINIPVYDKIHLAFDGMWYGTNIGFELRVGVIWRIRYDEYQSRGDTY